MTNIVLTRFLLHISWNSSSQLEVKFMFLLLLIKDSFTQTGFPVIQWFKNLKRRSIHLANKKQILLEHKMILKYPFQHAHLSFFDNERVIS